MLYEKYEKKIKKVRFLRNFIITHRVLLIIVASFLLAFSATMVALKGVITTDLSFTDAVYAYGTEVQPNEIGSIFDTEKTIEYSKSDENDWTTTKPIELGEYKARLTSKRAFGGTSYGEEQKFSIVKKDVTLQILTNQVAYGEKPEYTYSALAYDHYVAELQYVYNYALDTEESKLFTADVMPGSVVILNKNGEDVTFNYNITSQNGNINYSTRLLQLKSGDKTVTYSDTEVSEPTLSFLNGTSLVPGDGIVLEDITFRSFKEVNFSATNEVIAHKNVFDISEVKVLDAYGRDVTYRYQLADATFGEILIEKLDLTLTFSADSKVYDGTTEVPLGLRKQTGDTLIEGHTISYDVVYTDANVGDEKDITVSNLVISNAEGEVTDNYEITKVLENAKITKRTLEYTTLSETFEYDGSAKSYPEFSITSGNVAENQVASSVNAPKITNAGSISNEFTIDIIDSSGISQISNYLVTNGGYGTVTVTKKAINLSSAVEIYKYYDGTPNYSITLDSQNANFIDLLDGHTVTINGVYGTTGDVVTNAQFGLSTLNTQFFVIKGMAENQAGELEEQDLTANYNVAESINIDFTIKPKSIKVTTDSAQKIYNGKPLSANGYTVVDNFTEQIDDLNIYDPAKYDERTGLVLSHSFSDANPSFPIMINYSDNGAINGVSQNNQFTSKVTVNTESGEKDVTSNYDIEEIYGKLQIVKRNLVIEYNKITGEKVYDGEKDYYITNIASDYYEDENIEYASNPAYHYGLISENREPHILTVQGKLESKNARAIAYENLLTANNFSDLLGSNSLGLDQVTVKTYNGEDRTENYTFAEQVTVNFTIVKRKLIVYTDGATKEYDGTPLISTGNFRTTGDGNQIVNPDKYYSTGNFAGVVINETCELDEDSKKQITNVGSIADSLTLKFTDANGENSNGNYDCAGAYEYLTVTKRQITINPITITKVYDGTTSYKIVLDKSSSEIDAESSGLVNGHKIEIVGETSSANVGVYGPFSFDTSSGFKIYYLDDRQNAQEVTENYIINNDNEGQTENYPIQITVKIEKRRVDIPTQLTSQKVYDAKADFTLDITTQTEKPSADSEKGILKALGHNLKFIGKTSSANAGAYTDVITFNINGASVNSNSGTVYNLSVNDSDELTNNYSFIGTVSVQLTINKRWLSIETESETWVYDAQEHSTDEFSFTWVNQSNSGYFNASNYEQTGTFIGVVKNHTAYVVTTPENLPKVQNYTLNGVENKFEVAIQDENLNDVTSNYDFGNRTTYGTLLIEKRKLNFTTENKQWIYDGLTHNWGKYALSGASQSSSAKFNPSNYITEGEGVYEVGLVIGHKSRIITEPLPSIKDYSPNGVRNQFEITIYANGNVNNDVMENYEIVTSAYGTLKILKKEITITTDSDTKVYDGSALKASGFTSYHNDSQTILDENKTYYDENLVLVSGHTIKRSTLIDWSVNLPSITNVYDGDQIFTEYSIKLNQAQKSHFEIFDASNTDVTANYDIVSITAGELKLYKRKLLVNTEGDTKVYDGTALTCNIYEFIWQDQDYVIDYSRYEQSGKHQGVVVGESVTLKQPLPSITNVDDILNELKFTFSSSRGNSHNYLIEYGEVGSLIITHRPIYVLTASKEKVYDGTPLCFNPPEIECEYKLISAFAENEQGLASTDVFKITYINGVKPSITNVGEILNKFNVNIVRDDNGDISVISNYRLVDINGQPTAEPSYGKLKVTPAPLTLPRNIEIPAKIYDGEATFNYEITSLATGLVNGENLFVTGRWESANYGTHTGYASTITDFAFVVKNSQGVEIKWVDANANNHFGIENYSCVADSVSISQTINKRSIAIKTASADKEYDGTPLIRNRATITIDEQGLANENRFIASITVTGSQTEVGSSVNEFDYNSLVVKDQLNGNAIVTQNFSIDAYDLGTLTVTPSTQEPEPPGEPTVLFKVNSTAEGYIYLKEISYGDYNGTGYSSADEISFSGLNPQAYYASLLTQNEHTVIVKGSSKFYMPYYATTGNNAYGGSDIAFSYSGNLGQLSSYNAGFYHEDFLTSIPNNSLGSQDDAYYNSVRANYLTTHQPSVNAINTYLANNNRSVNDWKTRYQNGNASEKQAVIKEISIFVSSIGTYNLEYNHEGETNKIIGLLDYETGICQHYAATGTMLYRMAGIPARYTTGFMVKVTQPGQDTDVTNMDAHAWVEVYVEDYGWIQVEVTASLTSGELPSNPQPPSVEVTITPHSYYELTFGKKIKPEDIEITIASNVYTLTEDSFEYTVKIFNSNRVQVDYALNVGHYTIIVEITGGSFILAHPDDWQSRVLVNNGTIDVSHTDVTIQCENQAIMLNGAKQINATLTNAFTVKYAVNLHDYRYLFKDINVFVDITDENAKIVKINDEITTISGEGTDANGRFFSVRYTIKKEDMSILSPDGMVINKSNYELDSKNGTIKIYY